MEAQGPSAPPVVAVVVTCDAGPWLEEALAALRDQDYPSLSVLVIDDASQDDVTGRVAGVLPTAFVRRESERRGYAPTANAVLGLVEGASFFLLCHDDVAPGPEALRIMVEEAFRSNAGIIGPKLVEWVDPDRILSVGMSVDKGGNPSSAVEPGELDQEQHDAVRDVFAVGGGCVLVRADLFEALGGFNSALDLYGEDVDLCWRAQIAGARVVVAPEARVRHLEALTSGLRRPGALDHDPGSVRDEVRPLQLRHRLRSVLTNYSRFHLLRVLPQVVLLNLVEVLFSLATGRTATAAAVVGAWRWNLAHLGAIRASRRQLRGQRRVPDSEVRRLQVRGSARVTAFARGSAVTGRTRSLAEAGRDLATSFQDNRLLLAGWTALGLLLLVGTRNLIGGRIPAVGQLQPFPSVGGFLGRFLSGWHDSGLGSTSPAPAAFALLGAAGTLLLGATGQVQKLLVVGALPVGLLGIHRATRAYGSRLARLIAVVTYAAIPLPYDSLARGRLGGLIAYAAAPWVIGRLLRLGRTEPFLEPRERHGGWRRAAVSMGVLLAVVGALVPAFPLVVLVAAVGLALGGLLADGRPTWAAVGLALGGLVVAAVLLAPWSLDLVLPGNGWSALLGAGLPASRGLTFGRALRFQTGPIGSAPLGWAFVVVAALPLLIGSRSRLAAATRLWMVAIACWGVVFVGGRGWLHVPLPAPEVILAPAAVALALSAGLGRVAFESDLPGYRLGLRQVASLLAASALVAGVVPIAVAALDGQWLLPRSDLAGLLIFTKGEKAGGTFRVLWAGDPEALPLDGWHLAPGLAYGTTVDGAGDATGLWPAPDNGTTHLLADSLRLATNAQTSRLGHLLAPMAVRYIVVPRRVAPAARHVVALPAPAGLGRALDSQIDLRPVESDDSLLVYENAAWLPGRALLTTPAARQAAGRGAAGVEQAELGGSPEALAKTTGTFSYQGPVSGGDRVYLAESADARWRLSASGSHAARADAFGWANQFRVSRAGTARLRYHTALTRYMAIVVEAVLWLFALRHVMVARRLDVQGGSEQ